MNTLSRRTAGRALWTLTPVATIGLGAPFVAIHVALKVRSTVTAAFATAITVLTIAGGILSALHAKHHDAGSSIAGFFLIGAAVAGTAVAAAYGSQIFGPGPRSGEGLPSIADDASVRMAKSRERRRREAAELAKSDPQLARDLGIGRPEERKKFDDGGLVDINHVPPQVLAKELGLSADSADHVVAIRKSLGRFDGPDDLVEFAGVPLELIDANRDRLIAL